MKTIFVLAGLLSLAISGMNAQNVIPLYDKVPGSKLSVNKEKEETTDGILLIWNVSIPSITVYQPAKTNKPVAAVIICPGGAYSLLAAGHEGEAVAQELVKWGITAIVLKYRLPDDSIMLDKTIAPLQDVQRVIQLTRQKASEWNIDPNKIGVMGFSAGGHLAATASTHFDKAVIDNAAGISLRPDFSVLIYPVISFADSLTHKGSRDNLLGDHPTKDQVEYYSNELQVTSKTPPAFLVHAGDDETVKPANSILYYEALLRNKIFAELHLYPHGGHGFGMNNPTTSDKWMERLKNWLTSSHFL